MSKRMVFMIMLVGWLGLGAIMAQDTTDLRTFQPRESFITFEYPTTWQAREDGRVIALYSDEAVLPLKLNEPLTRGQFKILLVYLTANQREQANIDGTSPEAILQSVINSADVEIPNDDIRRYEFSRRLTVRSDFRNEGNQGAIWVMEMPEDAIVLMQVVTAADELINIEGAIIELLRGLQLATVTEYLYAIDDLERPQTFDPQQTRLVFDYPDGWEISEPNASTVLLSAPQTQIGLQFFDYRDLSSQGMPIDDPTSVLQSLQSRSQRPDAFETIQQVTVNGETLPYSTIQGEGYTGISLGRDIKVGFLWVTLLTGNESQAFDHNTLAWALLLTTTYRTDPVSLTERVLMPRHQFGFFYPEDWLIREVSPSSVILGTSPEMIDTTPDNLQFTDDAQLLVQYVTADEYTVARADTRSAIDVLRKFTRSTSDLTTYSRPRNLTLGAFEFAQIDFDNPNYSGTAFLAPMTDGGAVWMQLRTPPAQLGVWEPTALAIARSARIFAIDTSDTDLDDAIFDALNVEPTLVPTPTRRPDAPPDLGDVVGDVVATPMPTVIRELTFEVPVLEATYTTNFSKITAAYPDGWLVQESFPASDASPSFENTIRMSNNANLLLTTGRAIQAGDAEIVVQYTSYEEMSRLGFRSDTLYGFIRNLIATFPQGTFEEPLQFRINGDLMVLVLAETATRRSVSIHKEVPSGDGYVTVELSMNPTELELWLPTAIAVLESVQAP